MEEGRRKGIKDLTFYKHMGKGGRGFKIVRVPSFGRRKPRESKRLKTRKTETENCVLVCTKDAFEAGG